MSGKYPVGSLLPTEAQLSATFGVSAIRSGKPPGAWSTPA